jgi:hypothetical protein
VVLDTAGLTELLSRATIPSSIAAIILGGGIGQFKLFVLTETEVAQRVSLHKQVLIVKCVPFLRKVMEVSVLDSSAIEEAASKFISETLRIQGAMRELDAINRRFKLCYDLEISSAFLGVVTLLISITTPASHLIGALVTILLLIFQISLVFVLRDAAANLRVCEQIT